MKEYDNTNRGIAWKREKKTDNSPAYGGFLNVDGKDYEIAIWKGEGDGSGRGKPDITFSVKPKEASGAQTQNGPRKAAQKPTQTEEFLDDDIPW
jgi:hypothetical protein